MTDFYTSKNSTNSLKELQTLEEKLAVENEINERIISLENLDI